MAFNPGRNVGRLSIRVVPDTKKFRLELRRQLDTIERTTKMTVRVDKAKLDNVKIREDIRRQMEELKGIEVDANVKVTVDKVRLKKTALRKSIQSEFDKFENIRVNIEAVIKNKEHFQKEVRDMADRASRNKVKLNVNAITAAATTQMRWVSRDRIVTLIVRVSKKSVADALATLAALSGARLTWKWIKDLIDFAKELDKKLPAILGWTTGITSLVASLFAATSGLVGIGQGLFSILPAMLVLPGLLLNALGSATALIVALRNTGKELKPLKDDMSELSDIINGEFWGEARQPILDLVNGLMPQLRNAFRDLSQGVGEFIGAMSRAFGKELGGGRLESIFKGIAEGWRVLGSGADGFAGALVSLSNIAAQYTPRLAHWFVRQANTFDKWLKAISEDGRLGKWMEDAIDSMYDVWDVTRGLAGVFAGLWKAADQAGSGGLHGFAQLMLTWRRVVNSADFQTGLEAVFRGSYTAMEAFGGAVRAIGRLVSDNSDAFERFIGSAGTFLGGLVEGIADALNTPLVAGGLDDLSGGLIRALEGVLPHLPRIADTFGNFLGLLGDLAGSLLPTAAGVLEDLMPGLDSLIDAIRPALPGLTDAVTDIAEALAPAINDLLAALGPTVVDAIKLLADGLVLVAPLLGPLIDGLSALVRAIGDLLGWLTDDITDLATNEPDGVDWALVEKGKVEGIKLDIEAVADVRLLTKSLEMDPELGDLIVRDLYNPKTVGATEAAAQKVADAFLEKYRTTLAEKGEYGADAIVDSVAASDLPQKVKDAIGRALNGAGFEYDYFKEVGKRAPKLVEEGLNDGIISLDESMEMWRENFITEWEKSGADGAQALWDSFSGADQDSIAMQRLLEDLQGYGIDITDVMGDFGQNGSEAMVDEFVNGYLKGKPKVKDAAGDLGDAAWTEFKNSVGGGGGGHLGAGGFAFSRGVADGITSGKPIVEDASRDVARGARDGIASGIPAIVSLLAGLAPTLQGALASAGSWLNAPGRAISGGLASGINAGRGAVGSAAGGLRSSVLGGVGSISLYGVGLHIANGLAAGINAGRGSIAAAALRAVQEARTSARHAAEIRSPSRLMARDVGEPLAQGVAMGIDRAAAGVRQSMVNAVDMSDVSGKSPALGGRRGNVALHIHNPTVRDLMQDTFKAAQIAGVLE